MPEYFSRNEIIISLKIGEDKIVFDDLQIKYLAFSHEHVSYGPDEAFSATVGVYNFQIKKDKNILEFTFYQDINDPPSCIDFENYKVFFNSPYAEGQARIELKIIQG